MNSIEASAGSHSSLGGIDGIPMVSNVLLLSFMVRDEKRETSMLEIHRALSHRYDQPAIHGARCGAVGRI